MRWEFQFCKGIKSNIRRAKRIWLKFPNLNFLAFTNLIWILGEFELLLENKKNRIQHQYKMEEDIYKNSTHEVYTAAIHDTTMQ